VAHAMFGSILAAKMLIRVAFTAVSLGSIAVANSATPYYAPAYITTTRTTGWPATEASSSLFRLQAAHAGPL
jgi:hypothetical protein